MKKTILLFLLIPAVLNALPYTFAPTEEAVDSICGITEAIIGDSFSPMTHYAEGDSIYTVSPSYFTIEQVSDSPVIEGDNLKGQSAGIGFGRAISNRTMIYGIAGAMKIDGDIKYNDYSSANLTTETNYKLFSIHAGGGYDLVDSTFLSVPVFAGAHIQYYSAELSVETVPWTDGIPYDVTGKVEGSGFLYGVSGGIAPSIKLFGRLKITPYLMFLYNLNSTSLDGKITLDDNIAFTPDITYKESLDVDPVFAVMTGLDIGLESKSGFSVSLALGGLLTSMTGYGSTTSSRGVEMNPLVLIVSYKY